MFCPKLPHAVSLLLSGLCLVPLTASAQAAPPSGASNPVAVPIGINMSEAEYSWGSFPGGSDLAYIKSNHISLIRLPIAWERAQPTLGGPLNLGYLSSLKAFIEAADAQGIEVIVDVHDYGRYNVHWAADANAKGNAAPNTGSGEFTIGSATVPVSAFADLWTKVAAALKGTPGLGYYDLMNEPYNMGNPTVWPTAAQAAVNAIRAVDMNTQILVEGTQWASAYRWPGDNGSLSITDPANKVLYEAHLYFDGDGSGKYAQSYAAQGAYPNWGVDHLQPFLTWLKQHNAKGFLGEFGVPNSDPQWLPVLDNFLTALQAAGLSGTYWNYAFHSPSDPSWWPVNDPMSIINNGQANPQMGILVKHNAASPAAPTGVAAVIH
jgi:aryl-phospho-beta-D-glucosidase BglC (GH1 family)